MSSAFAKTAGGIGCAVVALPLLVVVAVAAVLGGPPPSQRALADIPSAMLALYRRAEPECPGLSWTVLAAIGKVESDHGRHPTMVSSAGAVGPMQFLPSTFAAYAHPVPPGGKKPPTPWDPVDAVYAAARLLCAHGARHGKNLPRAIWHYNHSDAYVRQVLKIADGYAAAEPAAPGRAAAKVIAFARAQLGTPYVWGGDGPAEGGFDCSGLTQAAYRAAAITIPRVAQAQYDHGPRLPKGARPAPGDLLFFGPSPSNITHVSIYIGSGRAIDAPRPGTVIREGPARTSSPTFQGATRPAAAGGDAR
ncbi:bifunctional lytic transglycosylase/C40 family peptidase [Streptomyces sp. S07_1.15]|uniref:bifunctional lytic transglycosylase/C40 family peptidase n=1 Tax=Streptomyces sp. S07_1.15 TaxID=2873925 RepID=UPI001D15416C|nr:bifunctional lytic transglycosylase/C40 family peptidase [Streptomyces sp. S07_1.15]MCC3654053.1 bifunctional lytic transglycosylase/C40 family peptidase [Streptomyces sp. S07_1.15]